jgi:transcription termination factor NusB
MKKNLLPIALMVIILSSVAMTIMPSMTRTPSEELRTGMRKLWEDHVTWTRNVILNVMDDLPGTDEAVKRLLKNQDDIGNAVKPYYGDDAGNKLAALLHTHITQAADLLKAAKVDDKAAFDKVNKQWMQNADEISMFLSKANPNWKLDEMKKMMQDHLRLTTDEAVARHKKDYAADVIAYDKVHVEILEMSDMLSDGIIAQFPNKFKGTKPMTEK